MTEIVFAFVAETEEMVGGVVSAEVEIVRIELLDDSRPAPFIALT
jgi:hypothetical protein